MAAAPHHSSLPKLLRPTSLLPTPPACSSAHPRASAPPPRRRLLRVAASGSAASSARGRLLEQRRRSDAAQGGPLAPARRGAPSPSAPKAVSPSRVPRSWPALRAPAAARSGTVAARRGSMAEERMATASAFQRGPAGAFRQGPRARSLSRPPRVASSSPSGRYDGLVFSVRSSFSHAPPSIHFPAVGAVGTVGPIFSGRRRKSGPDPDKRWARREASRGLAAGSRGRASNRAAAEG
ncbi:unnamed protein product [Urochloa humidicola]